ncbi:MAG: hypothetical protein QM490_04265 [Candidatus Gracilibacteria bacterium]
MSKKYKNLIIFIGEGKSEWSFISSLLKNKYGYIQNNKNNILLEKGKNLFCLAHPNMGTSHKGGDRTIYLEETYKKIKPLLFSIKYLLDNSIKINYFISTDIKESKKKIIGSKKYINKHLISFSGNIIIPFAEYEIETWFLAGIGDDFRKYYNIDEKEFNLFIKNKNIDKKLKTKGTLDKILPEQISEKISYIGEEFGRYIDIELGKSRSRSFKNFIEKLEEII